MKKRVKIIIIILIFNILFFSCANSFKKKSIATFNNGVIYGKNIIDAYNELTDENKNNIKSRDDFFRFVRKIALKKIILLKAYKKGLDKDEEITNQMEKSKISIGFDILIKKNVMDKIVISEIDYKPFKKKYEVYQIVKKIDAVNSDKNLESKKILNEIINKNKDLESFKEYAEKYSEDITASDGGYLGYIRLGVMEKSIDDTLKKLGKNEISSIIESSSGYHLLYVSEIEKYTYDELLLDKELYSYIYNDKKDKYEEEWYNSLLKDNNLKIDYELLKEKKYDEKVIVKYKDLEIKRKNIFEKIDEYKKNSIPEPTYDEIKQLVKNMALSLIIEKKSVDNSIVKSKKFKTKYKKEKDFLIINKYINDNVEIPEINDIQIKDFYEKNITTLFTFKLDDGTLYIQPLNEVEKFITEKLNRRLIKEARYDFYRSIVNKENLVIDDKVLSDLYEYLIK